MLTFVFAVLFAALSDPGGTFGYRVQRMALFGVIGALLTALGFGIGGGAWGLVVLAVFVVTLLGGLAVKFGLHRFASGELLTYWFLIAISVPLAYKPTTSRSAPGRRRWPGSSPWRCGSPSPASVAGARAQGAAPVDPRVSRLHRAGQAHRPGGGVCGDPRPRPDGRGGDRLRAARTQRRLDAGRRAGRHEVEPGAVDPGGRAAPDRRHPGRRGGGSLPADGPQQVRPGRRDRPARRRAVSSARSTTRSTAPRSPGSVLIAIDIAHPTDFASEGRRVLFTLAGVGIGVLVMLLANPLQKRGSTGTAKAGEIQDPVHPGQRVTPVPGRGRTTVRWCGPCGRSVEPCSRATPAPPDHRFRGE